MNQPNPSQAVASSSTPQARMPEFTKHAIFLGVLLSVVMGSANVYLGLKAGMTVSASIPAAVIAMAILRGVLRRKSLLESNMVQTGASAGESLAAGIIFTMPAMILIGHWNTFDFWTTTLIAMSGGLLGILFMIPMRKVFIVDNKELKYPEGVACAEVLLAGEGQKEGEESENATGGAKLVLSGLAVGGIFKFLGSYVGLLKHSVEVATLKAGRIFVFGSDISPALVGVGVIVGLGVSFQIFFGGMIGWLIGIPLIGADPVGGSPLDQAWTLWSKQVRYIGVGCMIVGGVYSIYKVRGGLYSAVVEMKKQFAPSSMGESVDVTERNLSGKTIAIFSILTILAIGGVYYSMLQHHLPVTLMTTLIMIVMAFFFTAVASYIVGLVGNSNSPVSGMTITSVLVTGGLLTVMGFSGVDGMVATLGVAGIVCCVACTSGDVCNDLKTGHMLGASPRNQQWMQIIGVIAAAFIMAPILTILHEGSINNGTGGIGGKELPAPQAGLFAALARGFFGDGQLPWDMVKIGIMIGVGIIIADIFLARAKSKLRLHVMPVAVGIYLPLGLSVPIFLGGLIHYFLTEKTGSIGTKRSTLLASGIIAGESLIGVFIAGLAFFGVLSLKLHERMNHLLVETISVIAMVGFCAWLYMKAKSQKA